MKRIVAALLALLFVAGVTPPLSAKGITTKIRLTGPTIAIPLEMTDPDILKDFHVWAGPGTWMNGVEGTEGFIIDWVSGAVAERPPRLDAYDVSFYVRYANRPFSTQEDQLAYVVVYEPGASGPGYVYLPGKADASYRLNTTAIFRSLEGHWFRATTAWHQAVSRLLAQRSDDPVRPHVSRPR